MRITVAMALLLLAGPAFGDEVLTSTTPMPAMREVPDHYELTDLRLRTAPARIDIRLTAIKPGGACAIDERGECQSIAAAYTGDEAVTLINALNSANLSTKSLRRRVLERLQSDGLLPGGTITGNAGLPTTTPTPNATTTWTITATATTTGTTTATGTGTATATSTATP